MLTLCFGGSFNPIHHGHLLCAQAAAEAGGFDRVMLIPAAVPPHKAVGPDLASAEHRLAMCRLAVAETGLFVVDDLELRRPGPSYTLETARELRRRGFEKVHWLIGGDCVAQLPRWHDPASLACEVDFVVMARPGFAIDVASLPPMFSHLAKSVVAVPQIEISATAIRRRVAEQRSIDYMTPPGVRDYIRHHNLYKK